MTSLGLIIRSRVVFGVVQNTPGRQVLVTGLYQVRGSQVPVIIEFGKNRVKLEGVLGTGEIPGDFRCLRIHPMKQKHPSGPQDYDSEGWISLPRLRFTCWKGARVRNFSFVNYQHGRGGLSAVGIVADLMTG